MRTVNAHYKLKRQLKRFNIRHHMSMPRAFECYYFKVILNWWHSLFKVSLFWVFNRAGNALFLDFMLALSRSQAELFVLTLLRSFLGLTFFRIFFIELVLLHSHAPWFFALIAFCALSSSSLTSRTSAFLDFHAHNFELVLLYLYTARTGQP